MPQTTNSTVSPPTISVPAVRDTALEAGMLSRLINERYAAVQVLHLLSDSCFYDTDHLRLFKAIRQLDVEGKEIDMLSVVDKLHDLAKELHVCILALSQINRGIQGEPNMAHLRDSGEIAEAADMVIILFNADFEHTTFPKPYADVDPKGKLLVKIEKNRDGATATFLVGFVSAETRIFALVESNGAQQEVPLFSYE